eukprot:TRINITY_DN4399_c0_g2_i1.p1 TRINITY_DN4399_c0_g2~~TRINITY_DN4399_c0_g2_i1.p1  ORF type:complete len:165 (-),score=29.90 TRINITY_DN4399_c0_g2_i1:240-734(-)
MIFRHPLLTMAANANVNAAVARRTPARCLRKFALDVKGFGGIQEIMVDITDFADAVRSDPNWLLFFCVLFDIIGMASYLIIFFGELTDFAWAPVAAVFLHYMFGSFLVSSLGFMEELLPFTDFIPTATIAWCLAHSDSLSFLRRMLGMRKGGGAVELEQAGAKD